MSSVASLAATADQPDEVLTATTESVPRRSTVSPSQIRHGICAVPTVIIAGTPPPGSAVLTISASVSPNSAATFARSSSVHGDAPLIRRCAWEYESPIASASQADCRYFGRPWRSISARTHATASDEADAPGPPSALGTAKDIGNTPISER